MCLVCVAKKYDDMLWDWMKSRFIPPRPTRLGLLYLFIVGGQCHTRPLMHVPGVLGCCAPVLMGPLSGVVIWKILYRFGDEDLVIWTASSASINRSTTSNILQWIINPLSATAFIHGFFFRNISKFPDKKETIYYLLSTIFRKRVDIVGTLFSQRCICRWHGITACTALARRDWHFRG